MSPRALAYRLTSIRLIDELAASEWRELSAKDAAGLVGRAPQLAAAATYSLTSNVPASLAAGLLTACLDARARLRP